MIDTIAPVFEVALQEGTSGGNEPAITTEAAKALGPSLAVGLGALGTGIAQRSIGASAVGAVAEDDDMFVPALIFTALPETLIIIAFVTIFLV